MVPGTGMGWSGLQAGSGNDVGTRDGAGRAGTGFCNAGELGTGRDPGRVSRTGTGGSQASRLLSRPTRTPWRTTATVQRA
jgi:hypothetical protein